MPKNDLPAIPDGTAERPAPVCATPSTVTSRFASEEFLTVISVPIITKVDEIAASRVLNVSLDPRPTVTSPWPVMLTKLFKAAN